eukprot:scaffold897_cov402-Prasinococcus_capsulatus_cf.AAC.43
MVYPGAGQPRKALRVLVGTGELQLGVGQTARQLYEARGYVTSDGIGRKDNFNNGHHEPPGFSSSRPGLHLYTTNGFPLGGSIEGLSLRVRVRMMGSSRGRAELEQFPFSRAHNNRPSATVGHTMNVPPNSRDLMTLQFSNWFRDCCLTLRASVTRGQAEVVVLEPLGAPSADHYVACAGIYAHEIHPRGFLWTSSPMAASTKEAGAAGLLGYLELQRKDVFQVAVP